jgi:hypothetical protein
MKAVEPKKRGRPATGRDPLVGVRLPRETITALDAWANAQGISRSEAVRHAVNAVVQMGGLAVEPPVVPKAKVVKAAPPAQKSGPTAGLMVQEGPVRPAPGSLLKKR